MERVTQLSLIRERYVPHHNYFRYYYMLRNSILLYKLSYVPLRWKVADFIKNIKLVIFFSIFSPNRQAFLKQVCVGIAHGVIDKRGRTECV